MPDQQAYHIGWRPRARQDLRGIIQFIAKDNRARSKAFGKLLQVKIARLALFPNLGRPGRIENTRELIVHPNYIVFYRVLEDSRVVQILRVKHAARQWP